MRFRLSLLLLLLLAATSNTFAQRVYTSSGKPVKAQKKTGAKGESTGFDPDKLVFGGGLSASFGTYTNVGISPIIGYRLTDNLMAGIGLGYQYLRIRDGLRSPLGGYQDYKVHLFTPSVWGRFAFLENFFAQAEYEHNFISYNELAFDPGGSGNVVTVDRNVSVPAVLVGGGLRQRITDRSSLLLTVLYNVYKSDFQIYPNGPIFRVGFNVGY